MERKRTAVVTGGASGIGFACAQALAEAGWRVIVADCNLAGAATMAEAIGGIALQLDVADEAQVRGAAARCWREHGPIDGLVNSAGVLQPPIAAEDFDMARFDRIMDVNFRGTWLASVAFGTEMARRGQGSIVAIASMATFRALPVHAYAASKAAVVQTVQCLAAEWGRSGVRVNAVSPGYVNTPAMRAQIEAGRRDERRLAEGAAMGRLVEPIEVGKVVAFLLDDAAGAITGVNLPVDCGWLVSSHAGGYGSPTAVPKPY